MNSSAQQHEGEHGQRATEDERPPAPARREEPERDESERRDRHSPAAAEHLGREPKLPVVRPPPPARGTWRRRAGSPRARRPIGLCEAVVRTTGRSHTVNAIVGSEQRRRHRGAERRSRGPEQHPNDEVAAERHEQEGGIRRMNDDDAQHRRRDASRPSRATAGGAPRRPSRAPREPGVGGLPSRAARATGTHRLLPGASAISATCAATTATAAPRALKTAQPAWYAIAERHRARTAALVAHDKLRVDAGERADDREEAVPEREGIPRMEAAVAELAHRVERERVEPPRACARGPGGRAVATDRSQRPTRAPPEEGAERQHAEQPGGHAVGRRATRTAARRAPRRQRITARATASLPR